MGGAQVLARVGAAALAAQPFAVEEVGAGELHTDGSAGQAIDRLAIEALGGLVIAEQSPRARCDPQRPVGSTGCGCQREMAQDTGCELGLAAAGGSLDLLG